jgi:hypothetical protein
MKDRKRETDIKTENDRKHRKRKRQEETERDRRTDGRTERYKTDIARQIYRERQKNRKREIDRIRRWVKRIV